MILETGVVVAVESDGLWVETIQKSACEVCVAEKGCGQKFLSKLAGKTVSIRVP
jgi:sigma-E factor negative regulatory protein RseC